MINTSHPAASLSKNAGTKNLATLIDTCKAKIGIIGLGYVGLPLALATARAGYSVIGFDIDAKRAAQINNGESFLGHIPLSNMRDVIESGLFRATTDFSRLSEPDVLIICVPTPLTRHREPDLTFVTNTADAIANHLRAPQLIVLESTSYPGTTTEIVLPILEATGLKSGEGFFLAFSPEREDPGNLDYTTTRIPKVVGGDGSTALSLAQSFYEKVVDIVVPVSSTEVAEAVKITENIFRAVNIALVNELKVIYAAMGIDIWEVIEAAKTKPFGFMPFYPGPGLGGHCIPIDPFYLTWKAREYGLTTRFIELSGEINTSMPKYIADCVAKLLDEKFQRGLNGSKILILGISYKKNIDDIRESPALELIDLFESRGAIVEFHDALVPEIPPTREHASLAGRRSTPLTSEILGSFAATLIVTDHDQVDYAKVASHAQLVVDTRNICARLGIHGNNICKV